MGGYNETREEILRDFYPELRDVTELLECLLDENCREEVDDLNEEVLDPLVEINSQIKEELSK